MVGTTPRLDALRARADVMVEQLATLVSTETPSEDLAACATGARVLSALAQDVIGDPGEIVEVDGGQHLHWHWPAPDGRQSIALIGHFDTVWPMGTLARWPFTIDGADGTATGPGCFDMKTGIIQLLHAIATLDDRSGLEILLTSDEEIGSGTSQALIEEIARRSTAAPILEPAASPETLKVGRKGTSWYRIDVHGRAAHAGLEPEKGANALVELAHLVLALDGIARPGIGTTVTPTLAAAGTAGNVVPATAALTIDVRVAEPDEAGRVDRDIRALVTTVPGASLTVAGGPNRPPLPPSSGAALLAQASRLAENLGLGRLEGISVGGGSDGNFTAAAGCPTLDGLGAIGAGAHAEGEWVSTAAMPERAALLADLLDAVRVTG
ncbi:MAG TPA: M20 family metallopeptidase [Actinopolymorphaceae bacterium]|jgi:glutamate carboxypeptidase